jgi:S1-C subfamily serine protease
MSRIGGGEGERFLGMRMLFLVSVALALCASGRAQQVADPYSTGMILLSPDGCPVFVGGVVANSPAERAGILAGDRVLAVDGTHVTSGGQAATLIRSNSPARVTLRLLRGGKEIEAVSERERRSWIFARNGQKTISGAVVPSDTTQAEVDRMLAFDDRRLAARVFPTHYPANPELFYPGSEVFVLRDPAQVTVGGIEKGPASKAGVHWGDVLLFVNGVPIAGRTPTELERMLSATQPAPMRLLIDRLGWVKTLEFRLEKASEIARRNGERFAEGRPVPAWADGGDLHCFLDK